MSGAGVLVEKSPQWVSSNFASVSLRIMYVRWIPTAGDKLTMVVDHGMNTDANNSGFRI